MLGQFSGKEQPDGGLDFPGSDGGPLIVMGQAGSFSGYSFENVVNERIHDRHSLGGHASIRVDLLQNLVNVDGIGFPPLSSFFSYLPW